MRERGKIFKRRMQIFKTPSFLLYYFKWILIYAIFQRNFNGLLNVTRHEFPVTKQHHYPPVTGTYLQAKLAAGPEHPRRTLQLPTHQFSTYFADVYVELYQHFKLFRTVRLLEHVRNANVCASNENKTRSLPADGRNGLQELEQSELHADAEGSVEVCNCW